MAIQNKMTALVWAGLALCDLLVAMPATAQDLSFEAPRNFAVGGSSPQPVVVGDFNRDERLDLAVVNYRSRSVSVLLGNGDGTFEAPQSYATGDNPSFVAVGDFNRDGRPDLVVTNAGRPPFLQGSVSVFLGNGDGTFQEAQNVAAGINPGCLVVGDFNGDGLQDFAVANTGTDFRQQQTVWVFLGDGDGTFQAPRSFIAGITPHFVVAGDFDGDGRLDLAVANIYPNLVSVFLGNGDGSFRPAHTLAVGTSPFWVAVGDFNRDGWLDLAVANVNSRNVSVLLGNGDGNFQEAQNFAAGGRPASVAIGDFNGDDLLDLAVSDSDSGIVSVLLGVGDGTFQALRTFASGTSFYSAFSIAVGDFNRDGRPDLVVANYSGTNVSVLINNTGG